MKLAKLKLALNGTLAASSVTSRSGDTVVFMLFLASGNITLDCIVTVKGLFLLYVDCTPRRPTCYLPVIFDRAWLMRQLGDFPAVVVA